MLPFLLTGLPFIVVGFISYFIVIGLKDGYGYAKSALEHVRSL